MIWPLQTHHEVCDFFPVVCEICGETVAKQQVCLFGMISLENVSLFLECIQCCAIDTVFFCDYRKSLMILNVDCK